MRRKVAQVVFNLPLPRPFDYLVPEELVERVKPGVRVEAPFGRGNRRRVGYCVGLSTESQHPDLKSILRVLDAEPLVDQHMLRLTRWIADYYRAGWGEVLETAIPSGVRSGARERTEELVELVVPPEEALRKLTRSPRQRRVVEVLAETDGPAPLTELAETAQVARSTVRTLLKRGLARLLHRHQTSVVEGEPTASAEPPPALNPEQVEASRTIAQAVDEPRFEVFLLLGVTGSGKTEVYLRAIERVVAAGRQAVVLVPEISLTPQTIRRFSSRLGRVAVLHSHLTAGERHQQWRRVRDGLAQVVIGARSAVFAPVPRLGLIVVDEEHETSFKQENAPRYHARDVAVMRARMLGVPVVLGSATPTLETYRNALTGKYHLLRLPRRVLDRPMPPVEVVDLAEEMRQRKGYCILSRPLENAIRRRLQRGEQVILFLNRRGFNTFIQCPRCGFVLRCSRCDISLVYHRRESMAVCHYCNASIPPPRECPECAFPGIRYLGMGTERIEQEAKTLFEGARIARMDSDVMRRRGEYRRVLSAFRRGEIDILVGTQMIAKGLDFPNVTLVGVINADVSLHLPDFRAFERTFQLLAQVAGRTGRGEKGGMVIVQTFSPGHYSVQAARQHDYHAFARQEMAHRRELGYPPFGRLVRLLLTGPDRQRVLRRAGEVGEEIRRRIENMGDPRVEVLGPAPALIAQIKGKHRFHLILKSPSSQPLQRLLRSAEDLLASTHHVQVAVDVDPLTML